MNWRFQLVIRWLEFEKNLEIKKCFYLDEKRAKNLFLISNIQI